MNESDLPKPPQRPCGSCPYRKDVPPGIWHESEYKKLAAYDGETFEQPVALFMCHQRDGCLCAGWLQTHDTDHLMALRFNRVHASSYGYTSDVPTFASGAEAAVHGMSALREPPPDAERVIRGLEKAKKLKNPV